jgi:hypothetical protein
MQKVEVGKKKIEQKKKRQKDSINRTINVHARKKKY